jgi:phosphotransferase system enzyme I (PtsP)
MSPASIGPVKAMLLGLDATALAETMNVTLDDRHPTESIRDILARFATSNNIPL